MKNNFFSNLFSYKKTSNHTFILPNNNNNIDVSTNSTVYVFDNIEKNLTYLKSKYNLILNSDINVREFILSTKTHNFKAFILYIDGLVDNESINSNILTPLLLKNSITMDPSSSTNTFSKNQTVTAKKFNLENFVYDNLIPHNNVIKMKSFDDIILKVNSGFCVLFIDTVSTSFCIETRNLKGRNVSEPLTETVVKGAHEAFVENIRTNTSLIRKIVNNENLIIEDISIGKISQTRVSVCYLNNITNDDLVAEVKYRLNNLDIDYLLSSGQLEQLIQDNPTSLVPEFLSTERPDKASASLLNGKVVILVNGSPYALILPAVFADLVSSSEDSNLNYHFTNFLKFVRGIAIFFALLLPGSYVAITNYHQELIPSELLFAIINAREAIPFPVIFEILIMEFSFELIQEASIRVSSSFSTTIGIIGALILGDAAVSANIVSPILIIVVAFTGICEFTIPDYSLKFSVRIIRFIYIILGYIAGFLGIVFGVFINFILLSTQTSFGIPFISNYKVISNSKGIDLFYMPPFWKRENRSRYLNTKKPTAQERISMKWRNYERQ